MKDWMKLKKIFSLILHASLSDFFKEYVMDILNACDFHPIYGIQKLFDKCLITVDRYDRLLMHDLLQQMGRDIIRRESP